jgi:hypothetical protein
MHAKQIDLLGGHGMFLLGGDWAQPKGTGPDQNYKDYSSQTNTAPRPPNSSSPAALYIINDLR